MVLIVLVRLLQHASSTLQHQDWQGHPMNPTKFGAVLLDKPKRLNYMGHLQERWQDQYDVKHPRESQVVHLGLTLALWICLDNKTPFVFQKKAKGQER